MEFIANLLDIFIRPLYNFIGNYGWTIIIFTVILKAVTLPFTIKSQKSMARMQQVQPLISEIQRKYANNREKMNQELMKVYDKYEISPTGGCMPMILQLIILMGFIKIVYNPYTHLLGIPAADINAAAGVKSMGDQLALSGDVLSKLAAQGYDTTLDLNFFGIELSKVLSNNLSDIKMWILPFIALVLTILSVVISQKSAERKQNGNQKNDAQAQQAAAMTKSMFITMPVMTALITYTMPLGCALYWAISTLTQIIQQLFVDQFIIKKMKPIVLTKKKKKPQIVKKEVIDTEEVTEE